MSEQDFTTNSAGKIQKNDLRKKRKSLVGQITNEEVGQIVSGYLATDLSPLTLF